MQRITPVRTLILLLSLILTTLVVVGIFSSKAIAQSSPAIPVSYEVIKELVSAPPIVLHLPKIIVPRNVQAQTYFGTGGVSYTAAHTLRGYEVFIQADPQSCLQALSCIDAYSEAQAIDHSSPAIPQQYRLLYDPNQLTKYVATAGHAPYETKLRNGTLITVLPWVHGGSSAGFEQAVWDEWGDNGVGYRYVIALKMGSPDALLQMVNSAFSDRSNTDSLDWDQLSE